MNNSNRLVFILSKEDVSITCWGCSPIVTDLNLGSLLGAAIVASSLMRPISSIQIG